MKRMYPAVLFTVLSLVASAAEQGDADKAKAKELLAKFQEAIVTVKLVSTTRYVTGGTVLQSGDMSKQDSKSEVTGTVINPEGLTVLSNYSTDPTSAFGGSSFDVGG